MFCTHLRKTAPALIAAVLVLLVVACGATPTATPLPTPTPTAAPAAAETTGPVSFARDILPLFKKNCTSCHGGANPPTGLNLETYAGVMKGNTTGPVLREGYPLNSLLWQVLPKGTMPKGGAKLSDADTQKVAAWIYDGAKND